MKPAMGAETVDSCAGGFQRWVLRQVLAVHAIPAALSGVLEGAFQECSRQEGLHVLQVVLLQRIAA